MKRPGLAESFLSRLDPPRRQAAAADPTLEEALANGVARAKAAWPALTLSSKLFVSYAAERLPDTTPDPVAAFRELRIEDLYLACACSNGDPEALRAFESSYLSEIEPILLRVAHSPALKDEVVQLVREKLFVSDGTARQRIAEYAGRGQLRNWVRTTIVRLVLNLVTRGKKKEVPGNDELLAALPAEAADPEMDHFKRRYGAEFRACFEAAVAAMDATERNLLRYAFADGLSSDQLGALYGIHRATAARRVEKARERLFESLRALLMQRLQVDEGELQSIVRLIRSRFDITLAGLLRGDSDNEGRP